MKYTLLFLVLFPLFILLSCSQRNQRFRIFGTSLRAVDITGSKEFSGLGLRYYTTIISDLTDDTTSYMWRLGSVRLNVKDYTQGTMSLFDLSTANHTGGYPMLDKIDMTFYQERGFQLLESKDPSLMTKTEYVTFKKNICNESVSPSSRRQYMWQDANREYRERLLLTRYFVNIQPISLEQKLVKKVVKDISAGLKSDVNSLMGIAHALKDSASQQPVDTLGLRFYFLKNVDRTLSLKGNYITVVFQDQYAKRVKYELSRTPASDQMIAADNEFNNNLKGYMAADTVALNSALFAFKLSGGLDRTIISVDSIKSDLKTLFNIGSKQAASLALTASFMFSKRIEETFKNQFAKVWVFKFGTDALMDELAFSNTKPVLIRKDDGKEIKKQQQY